MVRPAPRRTAFDTWLQVVAFVSLAAQVTLGLVFDDAEPWPVTGLVVVLFLAFAAASFWSALRW